MNEPQPISPRRRLQELLAIPERQRTESEWDELNELEITLTPINREEAPNQGVRHNAAVPAGHPSPGRGAQGKKPFRKSHNRPPKAKAP